MAILSKLKVSEISVENLLEVIPRSPAEFKIYDSCFSKNEYSDKINNLEGLIYTLASNSDEYFEYKERFIILYTNMYAYMYSGIFLNEERLDDGYYYYDINSLICNNSDMFCNKIWHKLSSLARSVNGEIYGLYKCRCEEKVLDEYNFCN